MLNKIKNAINKKCKNLNKLLIMNLTKTKFQYRWLDVSISLLFINFVSSNSFQAINRQPQLQYTLHTNSMCAWNSTFIGTDPLIRQQSILRRIRNGTSIYWYRPVWFNCTCTPDIKTSHVLCIYYRPAGSMYLRAEDGLGVGYVPESWGWSRSWRNRGSWCPRGSRGSSTFPGKIFEISRQKMLSKV